ncbi:MAG: hypothetical protein HY347_08740 [candidate division NC10 bacterium]|nr:hypothetical protein [candidate division NC10 bacterium]
MWFRQAVGATLLAGTLAACASGPGGEAFLRPGPQPLPDSRTVGERIVYSEKDITLVVEWLSFESIAWYYKNRPGLVNPFEALPLSSPKPLAFLLKLENRGQETVYFDPQQVSLTDQDRLRVFPLRYEDFYLQLTEEKQQAGTLPSIQASIFSGYVALSPNKEREGLLLFHELPPNSKTLLLELSSFYIGAEAKPLLFTFDVVRKAP